MEILTHTVDNSYILELAANCYGDMIKAVADVDKNLVAVDAELHSDLERLLLEQGSDQESLWGFNIYPEADDEDYIEYDSLINIRPRQNNRGRDVENPEIQKKIKLLVSQFIIK